MDGKENASWLIIITTIFISRLNVILFSLCNISKYYTIVL